jgi:signal transduction histidine kinase
MIAELLRTDFASPEYASPEEVKSDVKYIKDLPLIQGFIDFIPDIFLILNKERQIVYSNQALLQVLKERNIDSLYGLRPGEALSCINAKNKKGCGTTVSCRYCGAINAILKSQERLNEVVLEECRVKSEHDNAAFDFRVWAKTIDMNQKEYTMFVVRDISNEKRRLVLEKTFFHDILNTAGGIQGVMELLADASKDELDDLVQLVESASATMIEEIKAQKDILAAETGELKLEMLSIDSREIIETIKNIYKKHEVGHGKELITSPDSESVLFTSDARILKRILGNMVKNALEATPTGGKVVIGAGEKSGNIEFWVHNDTVMPEEVKMQMFQRSFSTKGEGRGIGTYSLKLLGEKYLKGNVYFTSEKGQGTVVAIKLPIEPE